MLTYRGRPGPYRVTIAISPTTPQIELVQPREGPSIYDEWLAERGEGLHHLGFWVDSLTEAAAEFAASGYEAIQTGAGYGLDGDGGYAYFDRPPSSASSSSSSRYRSAVVSRTSSTRPDSCSAAACESQARSPQVESWR